MYIVVSVVIIPQNILFVAVFTYFDGMKDKIFTYVIIVALLLINYSSPSFLLDNRIIKYLGKRILPIYCWHIVLGGFLRESLPNGLVFLLAVTVLTIVLAEVTYQIDIFSRRKLNSHCMS